MTGGIALWYDRSSRSGLAGTVREIKPGQHVASAWAKDWDGYDRCVLFRESCDDVDQGRRMVEAALRAAGPAVRPGFTEVVHVRPWSPRGGGGAA